MFLICTYACTKVVLILALVASIGVHLLFSLLLLILFDKHILNRCEIDFLIHNGCNDKNTHKHTRAHVCVYTTIRVSLKIVAGSLTVDNNTKQYNNILLKYA